MKTVFILGRQPEIGIAEIESLFGANIIGQVSKSAVIVDVEPNLANINRLGGTMKTAKLLNILKTTDWKKIEKYLTSTLPEHLQHIPEGKVRLGLSVYGIDISIRQINSTGLSLKKIIKAHGRSIRVVPNKSKDLNSAQVIHNQLTGKTGLELLVIIDSGQTFLAQTIGIQDIEAYADRDQKRPMRDAKVGMLPPKLAQIIINLASGSISPEDSKTILDPFCGTGVVLQEALLSGFSVIGTDLEQRMVDFSQANIEWLKTRFKVEGKTSIELGDATSHKWKPTPDYIASETYLGRPLLSQPKSDVLQKIVQNADSIHYEFLQNVAKQTKTGFRMCLAVPAWKTRTGFKHLKVLDSLEKLGYTRLSFTHVNNSKLVYHRPDQVVGRELLVLTRK